MSRSFVFNESVMYFDKLSSDVSASSDEEQIRVEVEHSIEKEIVTEDNDGDASDNSDSDNDNMTDSPLLCSNKICLSQLVDKGGIVVLDHV